MSAEPRSVNDAGSGTAAAMEVAEKVTVAPVGPWVVIEKFPGVGLKPVRSSVPAPLTVRLGTNPGVYTKLVIDAATKSVEWPVPSVAE